MLSSKFKILSTWFILNKNTGQLYTYTTFSGKVWLHSHGMFNHELGSYFAEQEQSGYASYQSSRVHTFIVRVWKNKQEIRH